MNNMNQELENVVKEEVLTPNTANSVPISTEEQPVSTEQVEPTDTPVIISVDEVPEEQPTTQEEVVEIPTEAPDLGQPQQENTEIQPVPTFQTFGEVPVEQSNEQITVPVEQFASDTLQPGSYQASSQSEVIPVGEPVVPEVPVADQNVDMPKKGNGLKVALIFLGIMIVGMMAGFIIWHIVN